MANIALVVLDTLRYDTFEEYFDWLPGIRFENAYSTSHWTIPAHGSLFTGLYPSEHGAHAKSRFFDYDKNPSLAELLKREGYQTRALSANPNVSKDFNFDRGFTDFYEARKSTGYEFKKFFDWSEFINQSSRSGISRDLSAVYHCLTGDYDIYPSLKEGIQLKSSYRFRPDSTDKGAKSAAEKISRMAFTENEFLFVNLMEVHTPYTVPDDHYNGPIPDALSIEDTILNTDVNPEQSKSAYDACAEYLSEKYEEIFRSLEEDFDYIITLSDHGHMFGEHGIFGHEFGLYPEVTKIPLTFYSGQDSTNYNDAPRSILDINRTILNIADIQGHEHSKGTDLREEKTGNNYLTECHGLYERLVDSLKEEGVSESLVESYNQQWRGITAPPNYYGYETLAGIETTGSKRTQDSFQQMRDAMVSTLNERAGGQNNSVPNGVQQRLEDLGYK